MCMYIYTMILGAIADWFKYKGQWLSNSDFYNMLPVIPFQSTLLVIDTSQQNLDQLLYNIKGA